MTSDQSNAANKGSRKLTRKPVILAAAANRHQCIRADARQYGAIRGRQDCHPTDHRHALRPRSVDLCGYRAEGHAGVVSINVKSDAEGARGTRCLRVDRS